MIHRYAAGTLPLVITAHRGAGRRRAARAPGERAARARAVRDRLVQALLGMLTVTWQLTPLIVTLHLLFGMTTLGLLWWLTLSLPRSSWGAAALA